MYIIAYDLGTGGCKASLYDYEGKCIHGEFTSYDTLYPHSGWHEQRPEDWWQAVVDSTHKLIKATTVSPQHIKSIGMSGHSLGLIPLDNSGKLLRDSVPIWSDSRPTEQQTAPFFDKIDEEDWYMTTGNGFPPPLYTIFKIMWLRDNEPEIFSQTDKVIGTKDYVNYKFTGVVATDHSYASGTGVYNLHSQSYQNDFIEAAGVSPDIFCNPLNSTDVLGCLTTNAAEELGLHTSVKVVAGGVDNSCMALGARCFQEGRAYNSLGSSAWIAISSDKPLLNSTTRPYVFAHVVPNMSVSATAIFSAGSSFQWLRDKMFSDLENGYVDMTNLASQSPVGANNLLFNPSLSGGSMLDKSPNIRGAFAGIDHKHTQNDIIRSVMEGVSFGLKKSFNELNKLASVDNEMLVVGGGSKSQLWRQIYADMYNRKIVKTNVDQQAAALGAAALAAVGTNVWSDFSKIDEIHKTESTDLPIKENTDTYNKLFEIYEKMSDYHSELGDMLTNL